MPKLFVFVLEISAPSTRIHCHEKYQIQVPKTEVLNLVSGCFGAELSLKRCAHTASVSEDSSILAGQIITTKPPGTVTFYESSPCFQDTKVAWFHSRTPKHWGRPHDRKGIHKRKAP